MYMNFSNKTKLTIAFSSILLLLLTLLISLIHRDSFEDADTIISNLGNNAGFYSMFFFTVNHYIYCKKQKKNFVIQSDDWLFKSNRGWEDYFQKTELKNLDRVNMKTLGHSNVIEDYPIIEYQKAIPELYVYNEKTKEEIKSTKNKFGLIDGEYDSIFIRRGDKLGEESNFITEEKYIDLLLKKKSNCKTIFLQTDDYNCYKKIEEIIKNRQLNIKLHTLCNDDSYGVVVHNRQKGILNESANNNETNKAYLSTIIDKLNNTKPVEEMNGEEKYRHSMDMIVGIDIVLSSHTCITDYQSNVSRFIKLAHKTPQNVFDIDSSTNELDYNKIICPAFSF